MEAMEAEERNWSELCGDCLVQIFSKLGLEDLTLGVPFVCKPWLRAALDPHCWEILDFRSLDFTPWSNFTSRLAEEYGVKAPSFSNFMKFAITRSNGAAVELAFPAFPGSSLHHLAYASVKCPKVRQLVLPSLLQEEDEKQIPKLIGTWKELEVLEVGLKPASLVEILEQTGLHCRSFMGLEMYGCFRYEDALAIVKHLPKLKSLVITGSFLRREGLLAIMDGCRELDLLDVRMCRGFDVDDEILKRGCRIREFEFEGAKAEEDYVEDYEKYDDVHWAIVFGEYW